MSSNILDLQKAALILFKSVVPINTKNTVSYLDLLLEGIYIMPDARKYIDQEIANYCIQNFSNKVVRYNKTALYNSFKDVAEKDVKELLVAQLDHYFSVYMQTEETSSDLIDSSLVHVPVKSESNDDEPFIFNTTMVSLITKEELLDRVAKMLSSGIALSDATQRHLFSIFKYYKDEIDVEIIKNKEFLMRAYSQLDIVPKKAEQLLRYLVYRLTNTTLFVNSKRDRQLIYSKLRSNNYENKYLNDIIKEYVKENGVESIAKQFNRYRKLWIIFKHVGRDTASIINRARKLSSKLNQPHNLMALDKINDKNIDLEEVKKQLEKVSIFKKFSLLNSIYNAKSNNKLYFIRNGRMYSTIKENTNKAGYQVKNAIFNSIKKDIGKNIKGKRFYIPDGIMYAVPTSEKNFIDNIPIFTRYRMDKNSIIGIHWTNTDTSRVDLDLHYLSKSIHVGWNSRYDSNDKIIFTGDITDAPKPEGATEALYFKDNLKDDFAVIEISNYAGKPDTFELFIANDPNKEIFDREKIISSKEMAFKFTGLTITDQTQCFGVVDSQEDYRDFIFTNTSDGFNRTPARGEHKNIMLEAMRSSAKNRLFLNDLIVKLGGEITLDKEKADYDLSINSLTKDSFDFLFKADV
jgi:hypothetical protein